MADRITLTLPGERPYHRIAHLVLGGLAIRLDLTFETLEDLQLALGGLLERTPGGDVTVSVQLHEDVLRASVGPFARTVREELARRDEEVGLGRILETVVDEVAVGERDGGHWVELTKRVGTAP